MTMKPGELSAVYAHRLHVRRLVSFISIRRKIAEMAFAALAMPGGGKVLSDFTFFKKPFTVACVLTALGILLIIGGFVLPEQSGSMGYYALVAFGVLLLTAGAVTYFMYRRMEREFQKTLRGDPLLRFTVDAGLLVEDTRRRIRDLKSENKVKLIVMLAFCALVALVLPFFFEDGYLFVYIGAGLAVMLSLSALIITSYSVRRISRGNNEYILSKNGAYVRGEYHTWGMQGTRLNSVKYTPPAKEKLGAIEIEYTAASSPAEATVQFIVPIPADQALKAEEVLRAMGR